MPFQFPAVLFTAGTALFDPVIEWHECDGMSFVKGDGILNVPHNVLAEIFIQLPVHNDDFPVAVTEIFWAADKMVMVGYYRGTNKPGGYDFKANTIHIRTEKNGMMACFIPLWILQLP